MGRKHTRPTECQKRKRYCQLSSTEGQDLYFVVESITKQEFDKTLTNFSNFQYSDTDNFDNQIRDNGGVWKVS